MLKFGLGIVVFGASSRPKNRNTTFRPPNLDQLIQPMEGITPAEVEVFKKSLTTSRFDVTKFDIVDSFILNRWKPGGPSATVDRTLRRHSYYLNGDEIFSFRAHRLRDVIAHELGHSLEHKLNDQPTFELAESIMEIPPFIGPADPTFESTASALWAEYVGHLIFRAPIYDRDGAGILKGDKLHSFLEWLAFVLEIPRMQTDALDVITPPNRLPYDFLSEQDQTRYYEQQVVPWLAAIQNPSPTAFRTLPAPTTVPALGPHPPTSLGQ